MNIRIKKGGNIIENKKNRLKEILVIIIAPVILTLFVLIFVQLARVPTASMAPTIEPGDCFLTVKKFWVPINKGDTITFRVNPGVDENPKVYYCKRVVGTPGDYVNGTFVPKKGDVVEVKEGGAYINDVYVGEAVDFVAYYCKINNSGEYIIKENCYYVQGDNIDDSYDSRYWKLKFVPKSKVYSVLVFCVFSKNVKHLGFYN